MRHLGEVGDHRIAGDVLAEGERERRVQLVVGPRADDLGKAHYLAVRVGDLESHAGLAGNGLDHADAVHRQRAGEVLHQVDDLAALYTHGGLDLVARDHRPRVGGEHLDLDAEIAELLFDQARGVFEGIGRQDLDVTRGFIEQPDGRQRRVGQFAEQRLLPLPLHSGGFRNFHHGGFYPDRRVILDQQPALLPHRRLALARGDCPGFSVLPAPQSLERPKVRALQHRPQLLHDGKP